jgi:hypothetical protein
MKDAQFPTAGLLCLPICGRIMAKSEVIRTKLSAVRPEDRAYSDFVLRCNTEFTVLPNCRVSDKVTVCIVLVFFTELPAGAPIAGNSPLGVRAGPCWRIARSDLAQCKNGIFTRPALGANFG